MRYKVMRNIVRATKYLLMMFKTPSLVCLSVIGLNILISVTFTYLFPGAGVTVGSTDLIAFISIFILGLLSFKIHFKFLLANAVSRKNIFGAYILSMAILSTAWAVTLTLVLSLISWMHIEIIVLYPLFYGDTSVLGTVVWFAGVFFLLIVIGWFINMVYYRSSKRMAYAISSAPFILSGLLTIINQSTNGKLFASILKFTVAAMGFSGKNPNPFIGSLSLLLLTMIICAFNFLLIRRAQIKE